MTAPNLVGGADDTVERDGCAVEGCAKASVALLHTNDGGDPEPRCRDCLLFDLRADD